ncbi:MAG: hypothetical protein AAF399_23590 [Bacteroidota bacterium]
MQYPSLTNRLFRVGGWLILIGFLTLLTQVGGIILLLYLPLGRRIRNSLPKGWKRRGIQLGSAVSFYLLISMVVVVPLAKLGGRVPLPIFQGELQPLHLCYPLLHRHYVQPELKALLVEAATATADQYPGTITAYLDASHPFGDGYPLLPHLSHQDGKKADLAFFFQNQQGDPLPKKALSWIGYGGVVEPQPGELDQPKRCEAAGHWQYSILETITPPFLLPKRMADEARTRFLLRYLARHPSTGKIFLEPHLKQRWGLTNFRKVRFHGCHAVRHDDHIHVQL